MSASPPLPAAGVAVLPEFSRPPLQEVALAVVFDPMPGLRAIELGPLQETWRTTYPQVDEQPPLPPDHDDGQGITVTFGATPLNRHLFASPDGGRLLQLQGDRLILNWRRSGPQGEQYPRYSVLAPELAARLAEVDNFAVSRTGRGLSPRRVELTYVNLIGGSSARPRLDAVVRGIELLGSDLDEPDEVRLSQAWAAVGPHLLTLTSAATPGIGQDGGPVVVLTLSVRGTIHAGDLALSVLDQAHAYLVRAFTELTRPSMHDQWGRNR